MSQNEELIAEALIGDAAKEFIESELGRCIVGMAKQDEEDAKEKMVDAVDEKSQDEFRLRAKLARMFPNYLKELITRGEEALEVWKDEQTN